jgi:hypothetical protein
MPIFAEQFNCRLELNNTQLAKCSESQCHPYSRGSYVGIGSWIYVSMRNDPSQFYFRYFHIFLDLGNIA